MGSWEESQQLLMMIENETCVTTTAFIYQLGSKQKKCLVLCWLYISDKKKFILWGKIEGVSNALSPIKLNTSAAIEILFNLDRFREEMLNAYNDIMI